MSVGLVGLRAMSWDLSASSRLHPIKLGKGSGRVV